MEQYRSGMLKINLEFPGLNGVERLEGSAGVVE
jgi:hypothetical protein